MGLGKSIKNNLPKTKKGKFFWIVFAMVGPIALGVAAGIVINEFFIGDSYDYSKVLEEQAQETSKDPAQEHALMTKYEAVKTKGLKFEDYFTSYEMVQIGYDLFASYETSRSITIGYVEAGPVLQSVRGQSIRDHSKYCEESLSKSSMVQVATRAYLDTDKKEVNLYRGSADTSTTATWNSEYETYTSAEYEKELGKTAATPLIYIVNKKTVLNSTITRDSDNNIIITASLDPVYSVLKYIYQMKNISGLDSFPMFYSVDTTFTLDGATLLPLKFKVDENYYPRYHGVGTNSWAHLNLTYEVGGEYSLPAYNENLVYPEEE